MVLKEHVENFEIDESIKLIFGNQAMDYVVVGGVCMLLGAILTMVFIKSEDDTPKEIEEEIKQVHF